MADTDNDNESQSYLVDLASVERCWPVGHDVPKLIVDVANLVATWPAGSVGYFTINGNRFDDYWIENGGELSEQFGNFFTLSEGTRISLWFHDGAVRGAEPVIEIGSEGELKVLAPNLKSFLTKWADGHAHHELDPDSEDQEEDAAVRAHSRKILSDQLRVLINAAPDHPRGAQVADLPNFMETWQKKATAELAANPTMQAIARCLDAHIPRDKEPWETIHMHLRIAGARVEIQTNAVPPDYKTFVPLPEREALIPLVLHARKERARLHPERGLWHSASLEVSGAGQAVIKASWEFEPEFREGGRMTKAEFEADLARFPKSPRWREPWMDELK
jgi:hypothetical protein